MVNFLISQYCIFVPLPTYVFRLSLQPMEQLNVDENDIIGVGNVLHSQLLNCQAEDWAIDDAIYMLGESVRRGCISTEVYLKRVRNLSRKQFYARAVMEKCREVSGLDTDDIDGAVSMKEESKSAIKLSRQNTAT